MARMAGTAGGSAMREYRRRRRRRRAAMVAMLPITIPIIVSVAIGVYVLTQVAGLAPLVGVVLALLAAASLARGAWGRRGSTEAWRIGAEGEVVTATRLRRLERKGFVVLHDRALPGMRANIDHVVVGPSGVFTVETKNVAGRVRLRRGLFSSSPTVRYNGRGLDGAV